MAAVTMTRMETLTDVRVWFKALNDQGWAFHPDTRWVNDRDEVAYTRKDRATGEWVTSCTVEQGREMDALMDKAFAICERAGVDIYEVAVEVTV